MKRFFTLLFNLVAIACLTSVQAQTNHIVSMEDYQFDPDSISIQVGDTVTWRNVGNEDHTTTSGQNCTIDGTWNSGTLSPGDSFQYVFSSSGVYPYYCIPHCSGGMTGSVTVTGGTGVDNQTPGYDIEVWPQPFADQLSFKVKTSGASQVELIIYASNGQIVYSLITKASRLSGTININLSEQPDGIYFYNLQTGNQPIHIGKLIKQSE